MMIARKLDLALEARDLAAPDGAALDGVRVREDTLHGLPLTRVEILDEDGARTLGKPVGT